MLASGVQAVAPGADPCFGTGRGMLTGKYTKPTDFEEGDFRRINPRFSEEVSMHSLIDATRPFML
jgi:hypothetical protein